MKSVNGLSDDCGVVMTADEVRAELEEELGGPFAEATWKRLYDDEVKPFVDNQQSVTWQNVKHRAEDLFEYEKELRQELATDASTEATARKRRVGQRSPRQDQETAEVHWFPQLDRKTELRAEVYGEYLAKVAADDLYVARYRKRVLGEPMATLTPSQAYSLIRSAAAQTLPPGFFQRMRIPVGDHSAVVLDYEFEGGEGESVKDNATIRVWWPENPEGILKRVQSSVSASAYFRWLEFRNEKGVDDSILVQRNSVLGELQRVGNRLAEQFPWREDQATWFTLTGAPPLVSPLKIRYKWHPARVHLPSGDTTRFTDGEVTISVVPWVPERSVSEAYFNLQRRILQVLHNQPLERPGLELLRFVLQREDPLRLDRARRRKVGKKLVEAWDRKYPNWAFGQYKQPTSAFWDAYNDAESRVMHPVWTLPRKLRQTGADEST
jgi:hypothetical protein